MTSVARLWASNSPEQLTSCPALLPDQLGDRRTFLDSVIKASEVLLTRPTTEDFLIEMVDWTGRSGRRSNPYCQNVLDSFYVIGLIGRTKYPADRLAILETELPSTSDIRNVRNYCIQSALSRLTYANLFLSAGRLIQPFTSASIRYILGMTADNSRRHARLFLNLGLLLKEGIRYSLTPLASEYGDHNTLIYATAISSTRLQESDLEYEISGGLEEIGLLDQDL